jgi:hypothetical protein
MANNLVQDLLPVRPGRLEPVLTDDYSEVAPSTTSGLYSRVVTSAPEEYSRGPEMCSRVAGPITQEVYSELGTDSSGVSSGSGSPSPAPRRLNPGWEDLAGAPWYQAGMPRLATLKGSKF